MSEQDFRDAVLAKLGDLDERLTIIHKSLKSCQSRCYVDNPKRGWRKFWNRITALLT